MNYVYTILFFKQFSQNIMKKNLKIIKEVELARSKNNVNWMNILRIAYKNDPKNTVKVLNKINSFDAKISRLLKSIKVK